MAEVMAILGRFRFSIRTAPITDSRRTSGWAWPDQPRIGASPMLQFVGPETENLTLKGSVWPHFRGGLGQVAKLRAAADNAEPMLFTTGRGEVLGRWVVVRLEEQAEVFFPDGAPRRQDFTLELRRYHE